MKYLVYALLAVAFFTSCNNTNMNKSKLDITSLEWRLVSLNTDNGEVLPDKAMKQPTLRVNADGKVNGQGGCNGFMGSAKVDGKKIDFGNLASTMMACPDMQIETMYHKALEAADSYKIVSGDMVLMQGKKVLATFSPFK